MFPGSLPPEETPPARRRRPPWPRPQSSGALSISGRQTVPPAAAIPRERPRRTRAETPGKAGGRLGAPRSRPGRAQGTARKRRLQRGRRATPGSERPRAPRLPPAVWPPRRPRQAERSPQLRRRSGRRAPRGQRPGHGGGARSIEQNRQAQHADQIRGRQPTESGQAAMVLSGEGGRDGGEGGDRKEEGLDDEVHGVRPEHEGGRRDGDGNHRPDGGPIAEGTGADQRQEHPELRDRDDGCLEKPGLELPPRDRLSPVEPPEHNPCGSVRGQIRDTTRDAANPGPPVKRQPDDTRHGRTHGSGLKEHGVRNRHARSTSSKAIAAIRPAPQPASRRMPHERESRAARTPPRTSAPAAAVRSPGRNAGSSGHAAVSVFSPPARSAAATSTVAPERDHRHIVTAREDPP